jgi:hypothetical protein
MEDTLAHTFTTVKVYLRRGKKRAGKKVAKVKWTGGRPFAAAPASVFACEGQGQGEAGGV